ncbi:MAG: hypothetical protein M0C28_17365 [Candidatus Moduliflexus flocculans]|nr:hypothetical protein [Candidatus Moduliflexus flocculans]
MLLVGPCNDHGWSQAHYEAGQYVEEKIPGAKMIYLDKVNSGRPPRHDHRRSWPKSCVDQGAKLIIFNSDDMKDGATELRQEPPGHARDPWPPATASGRTARPIAIANLVNIMGTHGIRQDDGRLRRRPDHQDRQDRLPRPADQRRDPPPGRLRLPGRQVLLDQVLGKDPADLQFKVTWIGFWFNIPGVTSDPTQVADDFFNSGYDVVISGIDTTEALDRGRSADVHARQGRLGHPLRLHGRLRAGPGGLPGRPVLQLGSRLPADHQGRRRTARWQPSFEWLGPDWADINNPDTSADRLREGRRP